MIFLFFVSSLYAMDFQAVLDKILMRDPRAQSIETELNVHKSRYQNQILTFLPTLDLNAFETLKGTSTQGTKLTARFNLWNSGKDFKNYQSSRFNLNAAMVTKNIKKLDLERDALEVIFQTLLRKEEYSVHLESYRIKEKYLSLIEEKYKKGLVPKLEVLQIKIDVLNARSRMENAQSEMILAENALKSALGQNFVNFSWPFERRFLLDNFSRKLSTINIKNQDFPSYKAAEETFWASQNDYSAQQRSFFPRVDLDVQRGVLTQYGQKFTDTTATLTLSFNLFNQGRDRLALNSLWNSQTNSQANFIRTQRSVRPSFQGFLIKLKKSVLTLKDQLKNQKLSKELYTVGLQKFKRGKYLYNQLGQDQDRLLSSKLLLVRAKYNSHRDFVTICHFMGQSVKRCLVL